MPTIRVAAGYLRQIDGPALTVGIDSPAEIMGTPIEQFPSEQTFLITAGSDTVPVRTQMIGRHHIYNCLKAAAVGLAYGIELPQNRSHAGGGETRARPVGTNRMRPAVQRVCRFRPYARRLGRMFANA